MNPHIVLAGDSIFDNAAYVMHRKAVIDQLNQQVGGRYRTSLLAIDGAVTHQLHQQFEHLPDDTSHLFISSGGNDALEAAHLLGESVANVFGAMTLFAEVVEQFEAEYESMLNDAVSRVGNVVVCTIYDSIPGYDREAMTALKLFNEVILRQAFSKGLPVIDLRLLCNEVEDYSSVSPIEPSEQGGQKIVDVIMRVVSDADDGLRSRVWTSA